MIRRVLLLLGLSAALTGGIATAVHAASQPATPATIHAAVQTAAEPPDTSAQDAAGDTDASAACLTNAATGEQSGDCADSQAASGSQDAAGGVETPDTTAEAATPDTDLANVQQ